MKKLVSAILTAALAVPSAMALPASAANPAWQSDTEITSLLSALNIMVGDQDGNFNLDAYVTRAEMAKIAVASSSYKNQVAVGMSFSPFSDVRNDFWGAPYIQAAVSAGIVEGYIDGTFRPDGTVTYEEAITMMLKVLGYSNADFGASYPYGQIGMAESMEMTDGVYSSAGEPLTRRQVARLVCNSLDTRMKDLNTDLISVHDCEIIEDVRIISDSSVDSKLASDEIATSGGKYRIRDAAFDADYVGLTGDMVIKSGKYYVAFSPDGDVVSNKYVVYNTSGNNIYCYEYGDNINMVQLELASTTTCYKNSQQYTYSQLMSEMEMGDIIVVSYNDNNEVDYINYSEGSLVGPKKVIADGSLGGFATDGATKIMRDGEKVTADDIKTNDIVYYSGDLNMVMAYSKKATGVYESASPSKDSPDTITVSGVSYPVEGMEAFGDLSSSGSLNYGDTITILFGKDGNKVAGVVTNSTASASSVTGYVVETGKKSFNNSDGTTYTSYYIDIVSADGTKYTYPTVSSAESSKGRVVNAVVKNGTATVHAVNDNSNLSGFVSYSEMTIGSRKAARGIKILDTINNSRYPLYTTTFMQRIDGLTLSASNVAYYATNAAGEITELILRNVTGDMYAYGIITNNAKTSDHPDAPRDTRIDIDSVQYSGSFGVTSGRGVQVVMDGSTIYTVTGLGVYSGASGSLTTSDVTIGQKKYLLSDKVKVYRKIDVGNYQSISLNDAISGNYNYTCYYDKAESSGGRVRVIVCESK